MIGFVGGVDFSLSVVEVFCASRAHCKEAEEAEVEDVVDEEDYLWELAWEGRRREEEEEVEVEMEEGRE